MNKELVAEAPRKVKLMSYETEIKSHQVKVKEKYASPNHGSELADFR